MDKNKEFISKKNDLEKKKEDKCNKNDIDNNIDKNNVKNNIKKIKNKMQKFNDENIEDNQEVEKKHKGYVRIFIKIIKNKNELLNSIMRKRFKIWKDEALKDFIFKKRITVRISVSKSKEKVKKQRLSSEERTYNKSKNDINYHKYKKINTFLNNSTSSNFLNRTKNQPLIKVKLVNNMNWVTNNNSQFLSPIQKKEPKKFFYSKISTNTNSHPYQNKEKAKLTYIKKEKQKPIPLSTLNSPYSSSNTLKKKLYSSKSSTGYKTIVNNEQKMYNNTTEYLIKSKNDRNLLKEKIDNKYKKIKVNLNANMNGFNDINSNLQKNFKRKTVGNLSNKNILTPNRSGVNIISDIKVLQKTNSNIKPYNTKKYILLSNNFSAKIIKDNCTYFKKIYHNNKNNSLLNLKKNLYSTNSNSNNNTFNREHRISSPAQPFDKKSLKKGITTVIQHYSFITEEFNNYSTNTTKTQI